MSWTYFDIETLPDQRPGARERAASSVKVPGNYKNPDAIAKYIEENAEEAYLKTALDGWKGHVICICTQEDRFLAKKVEDEPKVIEKFFSSLRADSQLVGHGIINFDIKFITRRALVLGVKLPSDYLWPRNLKPWDSRVFDTMQALGDSGYVSLQSLAESLGIEGKSNHGGAIYQMWQDGLFDEIADYCQNSDVRIVREIHQRLMKAGW